MDKKIALITGCDHGLGSALASLTEAAGYRVIRCCLSGGGEEALPLDISSDESVREMAARAARLVPRLDLLINNAGILGDIERSLGEEIDTGEILRVINVNAVGALRVTNALSELLFSSPSPTVVNISSEAGSISTCWRTAWWGYCMSKAANNMQGAIAHNVLRARGGRVIQLHPGHMATFMRGHRDDTARYTPEEAAERILHTLLSPDLPPAGEHPLYIDLNGEEMTW